MSHRRLSVTVKTGSRRLPALLCAMLLLSCCFGLLKLRAQDVPSDKNPAEPKKEEALILKSGGKVKFTTDEGTWMSLDLSPDGKLIVFDLLGDLYTLPVGGGEAKRIIGEMSFESQPKFSPDGQSIVFISDRSGAENLWVCKPDGTGLKAITKGRGQAMQMFVSPSWTADSKYIIASKADRSLGTYHVYLYHVDGGGGVSLGPPPPPPPTPGQQGPPAGPALNKMGAVASADGKYVYYAQRTGGFTYNAQFPLWQIIRFDRETSETMNLTNARGSAMRPLLSPDGRHLVYATRFQTRTALRVRDLETSDERWLIDNVTRDDQESRATRDTFPGYAFFPDGKSLLITAGGKIQRVDFATGQATTIPFTARVEMDIAPRLYKQYKVDDSPTVRARLIRYPKLSPDGKRLTFTAFNKVYYCELPNCTPKRLTDLTVGEFMPTWSPDGRDIAFATWTREGGHIYRATPGQGPAERLTQRAAFYTSPVYAPDNSKIVFVTGSIDDQLYADLREQGFASEEEAILHGHDPNTAGEISGVAANAGLELKYIPSTGGDAIVIGPAQGGRYPHFAQDSNRVYLTTGQGLTSLRLDGFDRRTHLRITGSGMPPGQATASQIVISPSGDQAFAEIQGKHFLVTIPKAGKETVQVSISGGTSSVPVKKMSAEGGDFLAWTSNGTAVTWGWGRNFYRQETGAEKPEIVAVAVTMPRPKTQGTMVLSGARIVTMKGDEVIERGDVVITDNRIVAVGPRGRVTIPPGAQTINVTDKTIIPGLVDVHAHMWPPRDVHQTQVWQYMANLAYGVTTTRDPQSATTDIYAYADLVDTGEILGPRIYTTGPGVFAGVGIDSQEGANNYLKRYQEAYETMTLKQYVVGDRIVRQWVAAACEKYGITPTTEGALDMKLDLSQMIDGYSGNEHALPIQPLYKDVAEFVAQTKTFYTPTLLVAYGAPFTENYFFENTDVVKNPKLRRFMPWQLLDSMFRRRPQWFLPEEYGQAGIAKGAAAVVKAGGRVGLGGHGQMQGIGCHWELWALQSGGMSPHDALRIATIFGAEAIGLQGDVGSIENGKLADLIVLDANPLADIRNSNTIRYVMKNGELFEGETLNQVWPKKKTVETLYWWNQEPK